jgi:enoyl-CoA hydratase/carnithine racemase
LGLVEYNKDSHLVTITLNRPDKLNALTPEMIVELRQAWIRYRDDEEAWLAIFTGAGRAFCAGSDKHAFVKGLQGEDFLGPFVREIAKDPYWSGELDKPTIVAVNGYALGGGFDLALKADLRVAAESARFQVSEVALGGLLVLWDNLPYAMAAEVMSGCMITGRRAYEVGMVNRIVSDAQLMEATLALADELLSRAPLSLYHQLRILREMKKASIPTARALFQNGLASDYTTLLGKELVKTEDWREANEALLDKSKRKRPVFSKK